MKNRPARRPPWIGITPDLEKDKGRRGEPLLVLQQRYPRAILEAGGIPVVLPIASSPQVLRKTIDRLDGIVVSGGNFDIHPRFYGQRAREEMRLVQEERTEFELELISLALGRDLPLLGICGGAQAINVVLGGSLYQDIATQNREALEHERGDIKDRGGHRVEVHEGTKLKAIVGCKFLVVNSTHHQAVRRLGKGLLINATAEDGVVEGIESRRHSFILGVQWHPEFLTHRDPRQRKIFASFVSACRRAG